MSPSTGSRTGGTMVTVIGTGFAVGGDRLQVREAENKALSALSVNCISTTECTLVTPAHEVGTVDVKAIVNKVGSAKNTATDQFTYN